MYSHASFLVLVGIPLLAFVVLGLLLLGYRRAELACGATASEARRRELGAGLVALVWVTLTGVLAGTGVLMRFESRPPPAMVFMASMMVLAVVLGLSRIGQRFAAGLPLAALIGLQAFRFPLELVMHQAAREGTMPVQMSFSGYNFDIVTGLLAIPLAWLAARGRAPRWLVYSWSALGFTTLTVIAVVAILSSPLVHAFGTAPENLNTWVFQVPFVWLPAVLVLTAIAGHVVVLRALALSHPASQERATAS